MNSFTNYDSNSFYRALAAVAITGPMLLVYAASALPEGPGRGDLVVYGHGVVLAILATAMILRAAFILGFRRAFRIAASNPDSSVTA